MRISVVVATYNRRKIVTRTLGALFAQNVPAADYEVIVVVDGSTDGTGDALRPLQPACRFRVIEQENRGPSAARNTGYRSAAADLVLFLDDDMLSDPGLVAAHITAHREPGRRIAFGALYLSADSPPSLAAECFNREIGAFYLERKQNPGIAWQITDCVFSNASLSRELLEAFGGFDETFRKREDLELGARLLRSGVQPLYLGSAVAYQYFEKTSADLIHDAEAFAVGDVMLARKHPGTMIKGQLLWLAQQPRWKRRMLRMAAASPALADLFLAPVCACGEVCFRAPVLRNLGVRALQMRRRIHWYRKALELGWQSPEARTEDAI
jgi:glycosyltransferase involved in cell wall biosynthesis